MTPGVLELAATSPTLSGAPVPDPEGPGTRHRAMLRGVSR